ncbi:MAG TPA: DUF4105 domain-containing protein [Myxococcota bacterium]|nr:DUF4105 domain-containing protein [Myxococcota bacterium]
MSAARRLAWALLTPPLILLCLWAEAALWIDGPPNRALTVLLVVAFALSALGSLVLLRPYGRALLALLILSVGVMVWWLRIPPRNDRDWLPEVARTAHARIEGSRVTIENVRDFTYRSDTDFDEHWDTRSYDLDKLQGADLFLSFWGPTLYAHTIVSWEFSDGPPLAISIETRKQKGESYSALLGFFRQYELYYVVADERDVIGVRDIVRGEHTYLYRLTMSAENARRLLLDYLGEVNSLDATPQWYNALTQNCTTTIRHRAIHAGGNVPLSWKMLANGYLDQLMYERGSFDRRLPFEELRAKSDVTERAKAAGWSPDFSAKIREGLPDYSRSR